MAKKTKKMTRRVYEQKRGKRRAWTKADDRELKKHSRARTPVAKISRAMKRTTGALRQRAFGLGMGLGHQR